VFVRRSRALLSRPVTTLTCSSSMTPLSTAAVATPLFREHPESRSPMPNGMKSRMFNRMSMLASSSQAKHNRGEGTARIAIG